MGSIPTGHSSLDQVCCEFPLFLDLSFLLPLSHICTLILSAKPSIIPALMLVTVGWSTSPIGQNNSQKGGYIYVIFPETKPRIGPGWIPSQLGKSSISVALNKPEFLLNCNIIISNMKGVIHSHFSTFFCVSTQRSPGVGHVNLY
jgi:hypothetical protein